MKQTYKQDRGVAGLTILLSVIVMLFIIGLIVMIFSLMSVEMRDATYTPTTKTVLLEAVDNVTFGNGTGYTLTGTTGYLRNARTWTAVAVYNNTNVLLLSGNYTLTGAVLTNASVGGWLNVKINYTYVYDADNTATDVMNDTGSSLSGVTDWFDIFIVISAMVVLILLTVIIITAIRSSGMIAGGQVSGANQVGTA